MALLLTNIAARVFSGTAGKTPLLGIRSASGSPAAILATDYAGTAQSAAPFKITLKKGDNKLVVVHAATEGEKISILEVDQTNPANTQVLAQKTFRKSKPDVTIAIRVA